MSHTFYLGGRKKGDKEWKYVEAPKLIQDKGSTYFADFPDGKELPPISGCASDRRATWSWRLIVNGMAKGPFSHSEK